MVRSKVVIQQTTSAVGTSVGLKGVACVSEASISAGSNDPSGKTVQQRVTFKTTSDDRGSSRLKVCYSNSVNQSTKHSV